jgi:hypothetical protein
VVGEGFAPAATVIGAIAFVLAVVGLYVFTARLSRGSPYVAKR